MQAITMYECPYCKKIFKTPDKHNCKRHPDKKNCFSCKHSEYYEHEVEDIIDVMYHNKPRWTLDCPGWEGK